jgi:hypothetical protein
MAQSVMTGVIDGTFAGYGLRFAPDSEMPVIRDFRAKSIWLSELVELGKSDIRAGPSFFSSKRIRFQTLEILAIIWPDAFRYRSGAGGGGGFELSKG